MVGTVMNPAASALTGGVHAGSAGWSAMVWDGWVLLGAGGRGLLCVPRLGQKMPSGRLLSPWPGSGVPPATCTIASLILPCSPAVAQQSAQVPSGTGGLARTELAYGRTSVPVP